MADGKIDGWIMDKWMGWMAGSWMNVLMDGEWQDGWLDHG